MMFRSLLTPPGRGWLSPLRIVLLYALAGGVWIRFSDHLIGAFEHDPEIMTRLQTYKGWFFILATALLLYWLILKYTSTVSSKDEQIQISEDRLVYRTLHDELTGLPNRTFFLNLMEEKILLCREGAECDYFVLYLDLDRFKVVNDSLGHLVGDRLLSAVAVRLREHLTPASILARLGGDEFAILAMGRATAVECIRLATQINDSLRRPFVVDGVELAVTSSIGAVMCSCEYKRPEHILRDADAAMHRAKDQGRGRIEIFQARMHEKAMRTLTLESDLRKALASGELLLNYQPIVSLADMRAVGAEALIRWRRPEGLMVVPNEFIPLAEDTGLIIEIGRFAFEQACRCRKELGKQEGFPPDFFVSVNVAASQLTQSDFTAEVETILAATGASPAWMKFEITESGAMDNAPEIVQIFGRLTAMGFGLALDDFGTGYSSLSYLRRFPLTTLKVDQSFIRGLEASPENQLIVRAIITLAHSLNLNVVAEGVETEAARQVLLDSGCEYGQGYHLSRPLAPDDLAGWLATSLRPIPGL
jgi:diguanylate cyclase (GGDEF)-like protein